MIYDEDDEFEDDEYNDEFDDDYDIVDEYTIGEDDEEEDILIEGLYEDDDDNNFELTIVNEYYDAEDDFIVEKGKIHVGSCTKKSINSIIESAQSQKFLNEQKEIFQESGLNLLETYAYPEYRSHNVVLIYLQYKTEKLVEDE